MKDQVEMKIYIHTKQNPILSSEIEKELDLPGIVVRDIIRELRRESKPIASCDKGYFWAKNFEELKDTIDDLERREISLRRTRHALENCFSKEAQLPLI